jgi:methionyl-tRNA synthetase
VWFDALLNYISAPGQANPAWPADVHLVGKEIFRFHTVIWPAMLMALNLPLPKKVFAHGWWTVEGTKMSKSLGNVVNPHEMAERYTADAFRYFLLREVPFGSDGDFSEKALLNRYNAELANNLGNLMQRTSTLLLKHFDGVIPSLSTKSLLIDDIRALWSQVDTAYSQLDFGSVLDVAYNTMVKTNKYIDEQAPWKLGADQKEQIEKILYQCLIVLKFLAILLYPFMPNKMAELWYRLGEEGKVEKAGREELTFKAGQKVVKSDPLFMRIGGRWK